MLEGSCHCGQVRWRFDGVPEAATACNCTVCRRYGALWAYDYEGERITIFGETRTYLCGDRILTFDFCPTCACVAYWRGLRLREDGRRRMGVNLRMAEPTAVASIPVEHLDGFGDWTHTIDGRRVRDLWF